MKRGHDEMEQDDPKSFRSEWTKIKYPINCAVKGPVYFVRSTKEAWDGETCELFNGKARQHDDGKEMSVCSQYIVWNVQEDIYKRLPMTHKQIKLRHDDIDIWQRLGHKAGVYLFCKPVVRVHPEFWKEFGTFLHPQQSIDARLVNKMMSKAPMPCTNLTFDITWAEDTNGYVVYPEMKTLTFDELGDYFQSQERLCRRQHQHTDTVKITFHEPATSHAIDEIKTNDDARKNVFPPFFYNARQIRFRNVLNYDELSSSDEPIELFQLHNHMRYAATWLCILGMEMAYHSLERLFTEPVYDRLRIGRIIVHTNGMDDSISLDDFQGNMDRLGLICPDVYICVNAESDFSHLRNVLHVQKVCTQWKHEFDHLLHNADRTVNKDVAYYIKIAKPMCEYTQWFAGVEAPNVPLV